MAKKKQNKLLKAKQKAKRYRKGGPTRLDMRKGGRVALQRGGPRRGRAEEEALMPRPPKRSVLTKPIKPIEGKRRPIVQVANPSSAPSSKPSPAAQEQIQKLGQIPKSTEFTPLLLQYSTIFVLRFAIFFPP